MTERDPLVVLMDLGGGYERKQVLSPVKVGLARGSLTGVIGANGSGKSTLLKAVAGRLPSITGRVQFASGPERSLGDDAGDIGYAAQTPELDLEMTVREHLSLFAALYRLGRNAREASIARAIASFGLSAFLDERVERCSGGMRQRLHLALSALHAPKLWLLDEPFTALDPDGQAQVWEALRQHTREAGAALLVSHDLARMGEVDQLIVLEAGRVLTIATPRALCEAHGDLASAYSALSGRASSELDGRPRAGQGGRRRG